MSGERVRIGVLGQLTVSRGGADLEIQSAKQRLLLAVLASQAGRAVTLDRLVAALWPSSAPASARANVHTYVHRLRALLGADLIVSRPGGYELGGDAVVCDTAVFEWGVASARAARDGGHLPEAAAAYRSALGQWRGEAFDGLTDAVPLAAEAARLEELRLVARQECYDCELGLGRHRSLIPELTAAVADHPLDEHFTAQAMAALHAAGRSSDALELYRRSHRRMVEEIGVEPGPTLRELQQSILSQTAEVADGAATRAGEGRATAPTAKATSPAQLPAAPSPFIGRDDAVDALADALLTSGTGPAIVAITGAGGVGKSALAIHVAHRVAEQFPDGQLYVDLRGATPGLSPLPPVEVLSRFVRVLAPGTEQSPGSLDELSALYRSLLAGRRILLILDDAADVAQLRPLLPGSASCAVLITSRKPLAALEGAHRRQIGELSPDDARGLLAALAGEERVAEDTDAADDVLHWCDRLPLAIGLAGAKLAARPHWSVGMLRDRLAADERRLDELELDDRGVRTSFALSCADLSPAATDLFTMLGHLPTSEVGLEVTAALIDATVPMTQTLLDELADAHLVEPTSDGRYRIHDLLRLFAQELPWHGDLDADIAAGMRRVLHLYVGTATAAQLTFGDANPWKLRLNPENLLRDPVALADSEAARAWYAAELPGMVDVIARAATMTGDLPGLVVSLATVQRVVLQTLGRWREARAITDSEQVAAARASDPQYQAQANQDQSVMAFYSGQPELSLQLAQRALGYWRTSGDLVGQAHGLSAMSEALEALDRQDEWFAVTTESLELRRRIGDRSGEAGVLIDVGLYHLRHGDFAAAWEATRQADEIADELGLARLKALALGNSGEIARRSGRLDEAVGCFEAALDANVQAGLENTVLQAEHWWGLGLTLRQRGTDVPGDADPDRARDCRARAAAVLASVGLITAAEEQQILARDDPPAPRALTQMF